jgi:hypothetical protein
MNRPMTGLSFAELERQLWDYGINLVLTGGSGKRLKGIVIRTETGDHAVAALHREGEVLVLDLGHPIDGH